MLGRQVVCPWESSDLYRFLPALWLAEEPEKHTPKYAVPLPDLHLLALGRKMFLCPRYK